MVRAKRPEPSLCLSPIAILHGPTIVLAANEHTHLSSGADRGGDGAGDHHLHRHAPVRVRDPHRPTRTPLPAFPRFYRRLRASCHAHSLGVPSAGFGPARQDPAVFFNSPFKSSAPAATAKAGTALRSPAIVPPSASPPCRVSTVLYLHFPLLMAGPRPVCVCRQPHPRGVRSRRHRR